MSGFLEAGDGGKLPKPGYLQSRRGRGGGVQAALATVPYGSRLEKTVNGRYYEYPNDCSIDLFNVVFPDYRPRDNNTMSRDQ